VALASGGMSHFPGTERYAEPDLAWHDAAYYAIGIPLTHLGVEDPVLPMSVNAYLPPQPTMERCYVLSSAAGPPRPACWASESPISSRWTRAGTTTTPPPPGFIRGRASAWITSFPVNEKPGHPLTGLLFSP
jgi:hypothetical protein